MFDLTDIEMLGVAGMLLLAWILLSRGGVQTYKLVAFAGGAFLFAALTLKEIPMLG